MTESLFLMQRYWGSDDSDVEQNETKTEQEEENTIYQQKNSKKKHKLANISLKTNESFSSEDKNDLISEEPSPINLIETPKTLIVEKENSSSKKKRKLKKEQKVASKNNVEFNNENSTDNLISNEINTEVSEVFNEGSAKKKRKKCTIASNADYEKTLNANHETISEDIKHDQCLLKSEENVQEQEGINPVFPIMKDMITKNYEKVDRMLPEWLSNPATISMTTHHQDKTVSQLDFLDNGIKQHLQALKIKHLFPVQSEVIPWILESISHRFISRPSDLCVSAPTGSGKTLAFVIPIVQSLKSRVVNAIRALVVLPVGDLAIQVFKVFQTFCKGTDLQIALVVGQKSFLQEQSLLVRKSSRGYFSNVDIIVSTPGRLIDHIDRTPGFSLLKLQYLIIDEADRMMDEIQRGWLKKVENATYEDKNDLKCPCFSDNFSFQKSFSPTTNSCIFGHTSEPSVQKFLFSATLSQNPERLHELSLYRPKLFTTTGSSSTITSAKISKEDTIGKYITPEGLIEYYTVCETSIKPLIVCYIINKFKFNKVLCFTQSIEHSHRLYVVLNCMVDSTVRELSSNLKSVQRKIILDQFENGKVSILVCSDLMARGMDINNVDCVISYDSPFFIRTYIHRVGRTARAGKNGVAITLLDDIELPKFKKMLKAAGKEVPAPLEVSNSDLISYEDSFKNALSVSSKLIKDEKRKDGISNKKSFKKLKAQRKISNGYRTKI